MADDYEHLAMQRGHRRWLHWRLVSLPHEEGGGIGAYVPCDLGHHWLGLHADGTFHYPRMQPYAWPTQASAQQAIVAYERERKQQVEAQGAHEDA